MDGDGKLTSEEFSLAMFLADMAKLGQPLPAALPPNFIPPSLRSRSRSNSGAVTVAPMNGTLCLCSNHNNYVVEKVGC